MSYLAGWAAMAAFALVAAIVFGKRAGYGLLIVTMAFIILTGWSKFAPALKGGTVQ